MTVFAQETNDNLEHAVHWLINRGSTGGNELDVLAQVSGFI